MSVELHPKNISQVQVKRLKGFQVMTSMQRHKILTLTKTYLTLSLAEIASEAGLADTKEAEDMLFDMISEGEIKARPLSFVKLGYYIYIYIQYCMILCDVT